MEEIEEKDNGSDHLQKLTREEVEKISDQVIRRLYTKGYAVDEIAERVHFFHALHELNYEQLKRIKEVKRRSRRRMEGLLSDLLEYVTKQNLSYDAALGKLEETVEQKNGKGKN
jgi:predicted transcriptional regulator